MVIVIVNGYGLKGNDESVGFDRRGFSSFSLEYLVSSDFIKVF